MPNKLLCPCRLYAYGALLSCCAIGGSLAFVSMRALQQDRNDLLTPDLLPVAQVDGDGFERVNRTGSVDIQSEYDIDDLLIPQREIHELLPKDAIPSLTDPELELAASSTWLQPGDRVIDVTVGEESVAVPLKILNFHEIANMTVGGEPVAATYCPLCDSTTVISRRVEHDGETHVLEFGVSGALYNSNVLMYDRTNLGLWSQLGLRSVSGPMSGVELRHLPMRVVTWMQYKLMHPAGRVLTRNTGHDRPYDQNAYQSYFQRDDTLVPVRGIGEALATKKTLGLGIKQGDRAWFITVEAIGEGYTLETPDGPVTVETNDAGVYVGEAPEGTTTVQTFYYSWSAFHPDTEVIATEEQKGSE
ncbi:MAG: DUF3179 domain-containing (seleno)protein [Planctomycetota bacterium]|jgi:hypothetical protein